MLRLLLNLFVASVLVAGTSGQDGNDRVPTRPDVGLSDQLRKVMKYYDSVLDEMRREHKSELSTIRREHKSKLSAVRREHKSELKEMKRECKETEIRLSNRITQLELSLSKRPKSAERRQISANALDGALQTILKHFKHQGKQVNLPEPEKLDNHTAAIITDKIGSVYTRWGRTVCDSDSALIYSGFAAGTYYTSTGSGANYQCMPLDPEYGEYVAGGGYSIIGGAEYETHGSSLNSIAEHNVPCARCYTHRSATMMIPGKRSCPSDWKVEYEGYLMSEASTHHRSTFECVDSEPEKITGEAANTDGALFYFVKADCATDGNTAHCPPYNADKPVTCVVCSK